MGNYFFFFGGGGEREKEREREQKTFKIIVWEKRQCSAPFQPQTKDFDFLKIV